MEKKIPLKKEVHDKVEAQAKAEGTTADELASEIVLQKATGESAKKERKSKSVEKKTMQPVEPNNGKQPFVNAYGFVHLNSKLMTVVGAEKGRKTPIVIDVQGDTLIIKKVT